MPRSSELARVSVSAVFISFYYALNHWGETGAELSVKEWPATTPPQALRCYIHQHRHSMREDRAGPFKSLLSAKVMDEISLGGGHTPTHSKDLMDRSNTINLTRTPCFSPCSSSEGSQSAGDTPKCPKESFLGSSAYKSLLPFHCHSRSAVLGGPALSKMPRTGWKGHSWCT